jgi:hypothetical protein
MEPALLFWDSLKELAMDFDALELDVGHAQLVVRWLKARYFLFIYSPFQVVMLCLYSNLLANLKGIYYYPSGRRLRAEPT